MSVAERLRECGHRVHIRDIDAKREALGRSLGFVVHPTAASLAADCSVIIVLVLDAAQVREVLYGGDGASSHEPSQGALLPVIGPEHRIIFCSTVSPQEASFACHLIVQQNAMALDAPVSGGPARAATGQISMMIAGPAASQASLAELLRVLSNKIFFISERYGDGARAKLVNNLLAAINLVGGAEAMALGEKLGLDPQTLLALIAESSGSSWMLAHRMPRALGMASGITAQTHVLTKDVKLANLMALEQGLSLPMGAVAAHQMQATCDEGWREADDSAVFHWYRKLFQTLNARFHMPT